MKEGEGYSLLKMPQTIQNLSPKCNYDHQTQLYILSQIQHGDGISINNIIKVIASFYINNKNKNDCLCFEKH